MRILFFISLIIIVTVNLSAQVGRLESEYKLDVPQAEVSQIWSHLQAIYSKKTMETFGMKLSGTQSVETFIDTYYDSPEMTFAEKEISLRHRKRFKNDLLLKELIQFKTPHSSDMVIRNEIKYEVTGKKGFSDLSSRHEFLKHLSKSDIEAFAFHLAPYGLRPNEIATSLKLKQKRSRVYLSDTNGESIATLTLDEVSNYSFPFQSYAELELELNEVRYTNAHESERSKMTALNEELKANLSEMFPNLQVDQRSKYHKMKLLVDSNKWSLLYEKMPWLIFAVITFIASFLFIKDQLH